jgi:phosphate-selective porin OprO and OprP
MRTTPGTRSLTWGALTVLCAVTTPVTADAQDASGARIDAIEQQIKALQKELQSLKSDLNAAKQEVRQSRAEAARAKQQAIQVQQAAQQAQQNAAAAASAQYQAGQAAAQAVAAQAAAAAAAAVGPKVAAGPGIQIGFPNNRPTISTSDGKLSFSVGMQVQFDTGGYFQSPYPTTQYPNLNYGVNLRRGRIFFVGRYEDFQLNFTPDFGGSPDGATKSQYLYEANINYLGLKPAVFTAGYFKPWYSLYDSESSNDFLQMERPSIIEISRNLAAGDARASLGVKWAWDHLFLSSYLTGASYGAQQTTLLNGEQIGYVGRVAGRPYYDKDWNLYVGMSGEWVEHPNINTSTSPEATLTFQDRPELRIDMNQLISTGAIPSSTANAYGGGVGINWRNYLVQGEYYRINDSQVQPPNKPSPMLGFGGGYVEAGWVFTGQPIRYDVGSAAFQRPKIDEPFVLGTGQIGALELSARYSATNLNSNVTPGVSQTVTGGVFGGNQQVAGMLLSWYPNDWIRLYLQGQYTNVNRLNSAGTSQIGQHFFTLEGRWQVAF